MKKILIILIIISNYTIAQSKVDELQNIKKELLAKIKVLNDSIKIINVKLTSSNTNKESINVKDSSIIVMTNSTAFITKYPDRKSEKLHSFTESTEVVIYDYSGNYYYKVRFGSIDGYIVAGYIKENKEIEDFTKWRNEQNEIAARRERVKKYEKQDKERDESRAKRKEKYIKKYGQVTYNKLKEGKYWLGMTKEMAQISLGYPKSDNRSVGSWGVHNQWVYDNIILYFENGELTSWQD